MKIIHLPPGPLESPTLAELRGRSILLSRHDTVVEAKLRESGLDFSVTGDEVSPSDVLLIPPHATEELAYVVDRLLGPGGCPWDQAQTHESLKKHLLEEAYEVIDAIDSGSADALREELGDLLLQPVLHAQMRKLAGEFDIQDVARGITEKLIRRHPHVFGDLVAEDADEVLKNWDRIKKAEKGDENRSILSGVPRSMASLLRAHDISRRAARAGFEWPNLDAVFEKLDEELIELHEAIESNHASDIESELGDVLFTVVNIARWLQFEPEEALRKMLDRFSRRFMEMERLATEPLDRLDPSRWDQLWNLAKQNVG